MDVIEWFDRGMRCEMKKSTTDCALNGEVECSMEIFIVYVTVVKTHPHHGCSLQKLMDVYGDEYDFLYADSMGTIGVRSAMDVKDTLRMARNLCRSIVSEDPLNRWKLQFEQNLNETFRRVRRDCTRKSTENGCHIQQGDCKFCINCGQFLSIRDTICKYCGKMYSSQDPPAKNSSWNAQTNRTVYY